MRENPPQITENQVKGLLFVTIIIICFDFT